jgi:hypothetical protein
MKPALELTLEALNEARKVFEEFDLVDWPKSERDEFYGEPGRCPVDYSAAQSKVSVAIAAMGEPNGP